MEWIRRTLGWLARHFLPWWMEPAMWGLRVDAAALTAEEAALVATAWVDARSRSGFGGGWRSSYGGLRSQEFAEDAESCFRATGECCFEVEAIEAAAAASCRSRLQRRRGGALQVWLPAAGREGVRGGGGYGGRGSEGDYRGGAGDRPGERGCSARSCRSGWDRRSWRGCAAGAGARNTGGAMIAVERNNHGAARAGVPGDE